VEWVYRWFPSQLDKEPPQQRTPSATIELKSLAL
jgi:hypothetical protein